MLPNGVLTEEICPGLQPRRGPIDYEYLLFEGRLRVVAVLRRTTTIVAARIQMKNRLDSHYFAFEEVATHVRTIRLLPSLPILQLMDKGD